MNIFFPNASLKYPPSDGPAIHRWQLVKNLTEMGHRVTTLLPDENPLAIRKPKRPWSVLRAIRSADVIYCRADEIPGPATQLTEPAVRWLIPHQTAVVWELNISFMWSVHTVDRSAERIEQDLRMWRRRAGRVDAAIGVARLLADQAREILNIPHTYVVQNGSDPKLYRPDIVPAAGLARRQARLQVVWIGSGSNTLHDVLLIAALALEIDRQGLPIDLHLIGNTQGLFAPPYPESIQFHGPVSYFDLPGYLAGMDVGLALYNRNCDAGSPLKLFDYLASGCVPVCSPGQAIDEVVDGHGVAMVEQWTAASLAERLMELHRDRSLLDAMAVGGRALVETKYNWRTIAGRVEDILKEAVTRRRE